MHNSAQQDVAQLAQQYAANNVAPLPITLVKGEGVYVYDDAGKRYLDMMCAVAVNSFGHCHPRIVAALTTQANKICVTSRLLHNETLGPFLQLACELTGFARALPMNSGTEAIETAIKAARKWAYINKKIPEDKAEIIVCSDNFHGRSVTAISMSSQTNYRQHFGPFTPGFKIIPFNDLDALSQAITANTAAFLVEPIQGEAGVQIPDPGYLQQCAQICRDNHILLMCDEIQTGMGRTGKLLACQHEDVLPDAVLMGKALGGGVLPVSLFLAQEELMSVFQPGDHGSTFGGNTLAAAVALEALRVLVDEQLAQNAARQGQYFLQQVEKIASPFITAARGKGLLMALDINLDLIDSKSACHQLSQAGLLSINTRNKCLRLLPPLVITQNQIDEALVLLQQAIK